MADPKKLSDQWQANEQELQRLKDLPTGQTDPAERERQLDEQQDAIEYELGEHYLKATRNVDDPKDGQ